MRGQPEEACSWRSGPPCHHRPWSFRDSSRTALGLPGPGGDTGMRAGLALRVYGDHFSRLSFHTLYFIYIFIAPKEN